MENEIWKDITGYEGFYQVSNLGRVRSVDRKIIRNNGWVQTFRGRIVRTTEILGYKMVHLSKAGTTTNHYVHRLVAQAFVPNPNNYREVNHKDEDKANNRAENIEWCTRRYNLLYGDRGRKAGIALGKRVVLIGEDGVEHHFYSRSEAGRYLGVTVQAISQAIRKKQKSKGFIVKQNGN